MAAGRLNTRVTFQREHREADGGGGYELAWVNIATVWGQFMPERGRERLESGRLEDATAGVLRVRWSSVTKSLRARDRVLIKAPDGAKVDFNIKSPPENPDQRHRWIEMVVERGVAS